MTVRLPKVLIFDSGAGGLSVAKEILTRTPSIDLSYAADNAFYPYGTKSDSELTARIISEIGRLVNRIKPDIVVVACNTASTIALDKLRRTFDCPFVGVVPAIKPAAALSESKVVGVLATSATVSGSYTQELIDQFGSGCTILMHASDVLVTLAEQKIRGDSCNRTLIDNELNTLFSLNHTMDVVVLACTHFPLLKDEFLRFSRTNGKEVQWIDSGTAIANRVNHLLKLSNEQHSAPTLGFFFSQNSNASENIETGYRAYLTNTH